MPSTPARTLRSNSSTPVSGNTAGGISTRARRRKGQPPIEINERDDDDDDEEEEHLLQTQLPLPTQEEHDDEDNDLDNEDDNDTDKGVNGFKSGASSNTKRTAKKTIPTHGPKNTLVVKDNDKEEEDVAPVVTVKPEVVEATGSSGSIEIPTIDQNNVKHQIHQYYYDIIDHEQHKILFDRSERISSWPILQHFWSAYPFNEYEYGRLYVRTRLCSLLIDSNAEAGYSKTSLVAWERTDWQEFIDDFRATKDACLNVNCTHIFSFDNPEETNFSIPENVRQERLLESQHRVNSISFNQKYSIVEKTCQMNLLLSPIRHIIESQILSGATGPPNGVSETDVETLHSAAGACDSFVVRKHIYRLFVPAIDNTEPGYTSGDDDNEEAPPQVMLKNLEDLKEILRTKPWDLIWLQSRIDRLIWLWNDECFGVTHPYLKMIKYHDATRRDANYRNHRVSVGAAKGSSGPKTPPQARDKEERADVLETLKRRRNALSKNHGDDPLIESRKLAAITKASTKTTTEIVPAKNIVFQGKKSNIVVHFDDSDDEVMQDDNEDEEGESDDNKNASKRRIRLPQLPKKRRTIKSPSATQEGASSAVSRTYTGPPPDEGIFDEKGNVVKRHPWNEEEIAALLSGLENHGLGKWALIKQEYGIILRNRTSVQLKDKFRNMKKNGELSDRYMADEV